MDGEVATDTAEGKYQEPDAGARKFWGHVWPNSVNTPISGPDKVVHCILHYCKTLMKIALRGVANAARWL